MSLCVGVGVFTAEGQRTPGCAKNFQNKLCGTLRAAPRQLTAVRVNTPAHSHAHAHAQTHNS